MSRVFCAVVLAGCWALPVSASDIVNQVLNRGMTKQVEAARARGVPVAQRLAVSELVPKGDAAVATKNKRAAEKKTVAGRQQKKHQRRRTASVNEASTGKRPMSQRTNGRR